jgi:hypothetical protein
MCTGYEPGEGDVTRSVGACGPGERGAVAGHGPVGSGEAGPREKTMGG